MTFKRFFEDDSLDEIEEGAVGEPAETEDDDEEDDDEGVTKPDEEI